MKYKLFLPLSLALLCGCGSTNQTLTPALLTIAVSTGTAFGVESHPEIVPALKVATPVICSAANSTNIQPQQIVDALRVAGVSTNVTATILLNGFLAIYDTVFASYGSTWTQNQPTLILYLKAICNGLTAGLPPQGSMARRDRKALPPHL